MKKFQIEKVEDFNVDHIFDCGQCFRWEKERDGSYSGIVRGKFANIKCEDNVLTIENADEDDYKEIWHKYLDMDTDYGEIKRKLKKEDEKMKEIIAVGDGIRILNQELWETIVSFIISANNNIPRIKSSIEVLCENFGEYLGEYRGKKRFSFPQAEKIAKLDVEDLKVCKLGYRDKYIIETAKKYVAEKEEFENLVDEKVSFKEAFDKVRQLQGVGPKVANCILLFSLEKRDSFPIDVWMKRVMNFIYKIDEDNLKEMKEYADKHFGDIAGIAQQYLFYFMRNLKDSN